MSEAVDKWVFDNFSQLFPPCGPGTPDQKKMLCGCDPTNPEHHVRHSVHVEPALKAKDMADGTVFTKNLSPSKIADILDRFGVKTRKSGIKPSIAESHGLGCRSYPGRSIIFGRKPIQGGGGAAASAAGASGTANPGGAPPPPADAAAAAAATPPRIPVADLSVAQVGAVVRALGLDAVATRLVADGVRGEDLAAMTDSDLKGDHEVKVGPQRRKIVAVVAEYVAAGGVPFRPN